MEAPDVYEEFCKEVKILPINFNQLLTFRLGGVYKQLGGTHHIIKMSCTNRSVTLTTKQVNVEEGWKFLTQISSSAIGSAVLEIEVSGVKKKRINFKFLDSKDVFSKAEADKLINELKYLKTFVDLGSPAEYAGNYCMQAAERGLSELLSNDKDFYALERTTHKHKNSIGFSGKTAIDRGKVFDKKGFVEKTHTFNKFKIDHKKKDIIYNSTSDADAEANYKKVIYDIVQLDNAGKSAIEKFFEDDLKDKEIGFHVYYFTVTDGFHTLLLIIDKFSDACTPTYEIWDQHGLTSSHGLLSELPEGIRRQTSWTFANTCLNRYKNGTTKYFNSTKLQLWKIKSK